MTDPTLIDVIRQHLRHSLGRCPERARLGGLELDFGPPRAVKVASVAVLMERSLQEAGLPPGAVHLPVGCVAMLEGLLNQVAS
jgi:hypothetical protein